MKSWYFTVNCLFIRILVGLSCFIGSFIGGLGMDGGLNFIVTVNCLCSVICQLPQWSLLATMLWSSSPKASVIVNCHCSVLIARNNVLKLISESNCQCQLSFVDGHCSLLSDHCSQQSSEARLRTKATINAHCSQERCEVRLRKHLNESQLMATIFSLTAALYFTRWRLKLRRRRINVDGLRPVFGSITVQFWSTWGPTWLDVAFRRYPSLSTKRRIVFQITYS